MNRVINTKNPVTKKTIEAHQEEGREEVVLKLDKAAKAFCQWNKQKYEYRANLFYRVAQLLKKNTEHYASMITMEMGKPLTQALAEVEKCALVCEYYADNTESFLETRSIETEFKKSYVCYQPLGTILQIMPWNFPFWQVFRFAAPTLMAGNVTILKHAPNVMGCAKLIQSIFDEAGFEEGVFQNLTIGVELVSEILKDGSVQGVALTGSIKAGKSVGALAGENIKNAVLELGGSDAFIVLEGADLVEAAQIAVRSRMHNSGQTCISAKRFIVMSSIAEKFKRLVLDEIAMLKVGNPLDLDTRISALAREDLAITLQKQVDASIALGAHVDIEGGHKEGTCYFYPMMLSNITKEMPAYKEELFGPVATFFEVESVEEAIDLANDTEFGLAASVWAGDIQLAETVALSLNVGAVAINKMMSSDPRIPFGGVKKSGIGRELGREGLLSFVNLKSIVID